MCVNKYLVQVQLNIYSNIFIEGKLEVTGRRLRRRKQLPNNENWKYVILVQVQLNIYLNIYIEGKAEGTGRRVRRCKQLPNNEDWKCV